MPSFTMERAPQTDDELYWAVRAMWGVKLPRHTCGHPEHTAPFSAFADAYFERGHSTVLWHGSRGLSGKSYMLSVLGITKAFLKGSDVNMLGGSLAQSTNIHEHMRNALYHENAPRYMIEKEGNTLIKLTNKARIRPLTASQKTVRGPHPPFLILDEIDEMDLSILDAALGQPMPQINYLGEEIKPFTVMCVAGETKILTPDGEVRIDEMAPGNQVMTRQGWRSVRRVVCNGKRKVVRVTFSNGRVLTCTDDHKIAVGEGWLTPKDMLAAISSSQSSPLIVTSFTTDLALSSSMNTDESVLGSEFVPVGAVGLGGVDDTGSQTSLPVDSGRNSFQVGGVYTGGGLAKVIDFETFWDRPYQADMTPSVDILFRDELAVDDSVATDNFGAIPNPAAISVFGALSSEPVFVVSISDELDHEIPVYDLEVDDVHEYVAESIIISNCSTWQNPDGTFTAIRRRFEERGLPIITWCYACSANPVDGWLSQETIDAKKLEIPAEMWRTEYELGEPAIGNRAFDPDAVEQTFSIPHKPIREKIQKDFEEYTFEEPNRYGHYVAAADWGKEKDYTVISVMRYDIADEPARLVYWMRVNRRPYPQMIGWFNDAIKTYNAIAIHDGTGLGNVVNDYVDLRARSFIMSGAARDNMLSEYVSALENGQVSYPQFKTNYIAHKYARVGDLYSNRQEFHLPDEVCSLALAWRVIKRNGRQGGDPILIRRDSKPTRLEANFLPEEERTPEPVEKVIMVTTEKPGGLSLMV